MDLAGAFVIFWAELGGEGQDGFAALLILIGDVHDEGRADVGVRSGVENFEGAVGFANDGQLLEAGEEAALVAKSGGVVMVWMTRFPVGQNHGLRTKLANHGREA